MRETRKRSEDRRAGHGWLFGLFGGSLLISFGFVIGVVVGATWEDSELVVRHAQGRSEVVSLDELTGPPIVTESRVADPGARPASRETAISNPDVAAAPPPGRTRPPAPAVEPSSVVEGFEVQVGAFVARAPADELSQRLEGKGFSVHVSARSSDGDHRWRVRVGPVGTRGEADTLALRLKRDEKLPTWIVATDAR